MLSGRFHHGASFSSGVVRLSSSLRRASSSSASRHVNEDLGSGQSGSLPSAAPSSISSSVKDGAAWPPSSAFASYTVALAPTPAQLKYADRFFETSRPLFLRSHAKFRTLPVSSVPEVAFVGRSNVGKSSLLNALIHRTGVKLASISSKPGRTRLMNAFGIGNIQVIGGPSKNPKRRKSHDNSTTDTSSSTAQEPFEPERWEGRGGLVIIDMPGYGHASREEWGHEIVKYLTARKQLRRTFVLIDCEHGIKSSDLHMLYLLGQQGVPYQLVLSKIDKILVPSSKPTIESLNKRLAKLPDIAHTIRQNIAPQGGKTRLAQDDLIMCSAEVAVPPGSGKKIGINNLRWAVLSAVGLEADPSGRKRVVDANILSEEPMGA